MLEFDKLFGLFTHRVFAWISRFKAYGSLIPDIAITRLWLLVMEY